MGFGIFGGNSSSKSTTATTQKDQRATFGDGGVYASEGATVNVTAGEAFAVVDSAIGKTQQTTKELTTQAFKSIEKTGDLVAAAYDEAKGRGVMTDYITLAALGVAGAVAFMALKGKQ